MSNNIIERDLRHIWHPCSQMKDYELFKPLVVKQASGPYIELENGKKIIDAISSWWCKSLGHGHPRLKRALQNQVEFFEHILLVNTTHETIVKLAEKLAALTKNLDKVFFAGDGSCAIEIAMKMSLHAHQLKGEKQRTRFIALQNSYHGETLGALSVSDLGIYRDPYAPLLFDTKFIDPVPYVYSKQDPLWEDCSEYWPQIEKQLAQYAKQTTAILIEPVLQAANGMRIYSKDFLCRLRKWSRENNIHLIADEIMTGIGRTGLPLACDHAGIKADFLCLGKGLTAGWLPLSAVLTSTEVYNLFYDDYEKGKSFLHSHTYTGNALAVSIALECLNVMGEEQVYENVRNNEPYLHKLFLEIAANTGKLTNIRHIGAVVAADLVVTDPSSRAGFAVYKKAVELGALLRPLGNTIYWVPPLNITHEVLDELAAITQTAINEVLN